jgi:phosphomannomutase
MTIRTSGTEPKIKWYSEIKQLNMTRSREEIRDELNDLVKHMINEFYQPEANNLKARTT